MARMPQAAANTSGSVATKAARRSATRSGTLSAICGGNRRRMAVSAMASRPASAALPAVKRKAPRPSSLKAAPPRDDVIPVEGPYLTYTRRTPIGVVANCTPFTPR
ncbi:hypothetical protein V5F59_17605 [Xanthobacter autotrophicus DSM 431]